MQIRLYNSLSKKKEIFKPVKKGLINFYYCGPTVYWTQHIGNLRSAFSADILARTFKYLDYKVNYVRNYTDVGHLTSDEDEGVDKMAKAAARDNLSPEIIAKNYIKIYEKDTKKLNLLEPSFKPRATRHIKEIIALIKILLKKKYAYRTDLAIYFEVKKFKNYTKLSGQDLAKNISGAGSGEVSDPKKKNPVDFALWFFRAGAHDKALQFWPSPFQSALVKNGDGFPGWHIECSAMSKKYLGKTLDIHMGGREHIPVHHTNEIAQSEAANGVKFVNYWLHNEHLLADNNKMSKSSGTAYSLAEVEERGFSPLALRFLYLQAHYRSKLNFTWEVLAAAQAGLDSLNLKIKNLNLKKNNPLKINLKFKNKLIAALSDDLNTPKGLAIIQELLKSNLNPEEKLATILDFDQVLGLGLAKNLKQKKINIPKKIKILILKRQKAREEKNWELADNLREEINSLGYKIEDAKNTQEVIKIKD